MKRLRLDNNQKAFFELLRAGLWEKDAHLLPYGEINYEAIQTLAEEQAVLGLIMAGMEHVVDTKVPRMDYLQFAGVALKIEKQNEEMNRFVGELFRKLEAEGIKALLVKGQGIAQCYERPLLRMSGDVDLLLDEENYKRAKEFITPMASEVETENVNDWHYGLWIGSWEVELHGTMRSISLPWMDRVVDKVQAVAFRSGAVRIWDDEGVQVPLPGIDADVVFIFSHIVKHFYNSGIGIRQVCDWCRLLYKYRDSIDVPQLESRLRAAGIMTEWKAFAALAVEKLGMPAEYMPFYSPRRKWARKADKLLAHILIMGNFGHNIETEDNLSKSGNITKFFVIVWRLTLTESEHAAIFPLDSFKVWCVKLSGVISHIMNKLSDKA